MCFVKYVYNKKSPEFQFLISWKSTISSSEGRSLEASRINQSLKNGTDANLYPQF